MNFSLLALILRAAVLLFLCGPALVNAALAQAPSSKKTKSTTPKTTQNGAQQARANSPFILSGFEGKLVSAVDASKPDSGDYIICEFTVEQLLTLRPRPAVVAFGSYEEERLKTQVITEAFSQNTDSEFTEQVRTLFINYIVQEHFIGLTPSEALARVIWDLSSAKNNPTAGSVSQVQSQAAAQAAAAQAAAAQAAAQAAAAQAAAARAIAAQATAAQAAAAQATAAQATPARAIAAQATAAQAAAAQATAAEEAAQESAQAAAARARVAAQAALPTATNSAAAAIVDSARSTINAFQRPDDIGCAMSILGWNELRYAFGQTIADEYIGVQIVVRNVNPNKEFLIHDAEISVDSDLNGRYGRYYSGQDKLVVRGFMLASRDYGRRNFVVHLAQGIGAVMSATSLIYGLPLQSATNVFNAGFLSALTTVWTDHNTDQLNLLNDVGFSASKTDRTVVPKSGTAMFVIFISSKQFQNGWWVQDCANNIVLNPAPAQPSTAAQAAAAQATAAQEAAGQSSQPTQRVGGGSLQSGLDLDSLRAICLKEAAVKPSSTSEGSPATSGSGQSGQPGNAGVQYMKPKAVTYKKWSPTATAIFHELTLAVVAGTHFTEDTKASISAISCPVDELGNLDYSKATGDTLTCALTGQALDKAQKLRLRNADNATDTKNAEGTVSTSGDSTKATVKFQLADLGNLGAPAYKVYTVTTDSVESGGAQILRLSSEPFLPDDPSRPELQLGELSAKGATAATITLKGYHLDKLTSVHLGNSEKEVAAADSISIDAKIKGSPSATAASFDVTPAQVAKLPPGDYTKDKLKMYIFLVSKDPPGIKAPTGQILYGSGMLNAAAAKPAAPGKTTTSQPAATPPSPKAGAKVTLSVTVAAADGKGTPTGTVKFLSDAKSVGSAKLTKGTAILSLEKGLTAATHSITAAYQGDQSYAQSTSDSLKLTVTK
jgi:hypothetical protein